MLKFKRKTEVFGRTNNNKVVNFEGSENLIGHLVDVHIDEVRGNTLHGSLNDMILNIDKTYEHKIL